MLALDAQNDDRTTSTRKFIAMFNRFFDIMNVRDKTQGYRSRNKDLNPYKKDDDKDGRLTVSRLKLSME